MAEARGRERWAHTSSVLALLANAHRDPKKTSAFKPADFNPYLRAKETPLPKVGVQVLKQVFVDHRPET